MGAFLNYPKTEKETFTGEGGGIKFGVSAMQGWRKEMEDAHICKTELPFGKDYSFFGVFDGHAGSQVAKTSSDELVKWIITSLPDDISNLDKVGIQDGIKAGFIHMDNALEKSKLKDRSGTTAIVSLITPNEVIFANCGDSRGIMCNNGKMHFATMDHKPYNAIEKDRIEKAGGTVIMQRVNGSLAVSRALGDFDFKKSEEVGPCDQLVSPEPEITVIKREAEGDQFLILACDGIFDVVTNEEVVEFVLRKLEFMDDLSKICSDLIDMCLNKNSRDNMSVILVTFCNAPKVTKEGIEKSEKLQKEAKKVIEDHITEIASDAEDALDLEINNVMFKLGSVVPSEYEIYSNSNKDMISALLDEHRKRLFGNVETDFNSQYSDLSNPPSYLLGDEDQYDNSLIPSSQRDTFSTAGSNPPELSESEPMVTTTTTTTTTTTQPQTSSLPESNIPTVTAGSSLSPNNDVEQS